MWNRREFLRGAALVGAAGPCPVFPVARWVQSQGACGLSSGGGFGGATVAAHLRMWSQQGVDVDPDERNPTFISCPISNLVIGGDKRMADITMSYDGLRSTWGVRSS